MKPTILKLSIYFILIILLGASCELFTNQEDMPGIAIYKTNYDYFDLVTIGMKEDRIFRTGTYSQGTSRIIISNNDTIFKNRIRLVNGYVLSCESSSQYDVFLNITFKQYIRMENKYEGFTIPQDTLKKYIIDKNPYSEFYKDNTNPRRFPYTEIGEIDTTSINQIIRDGKIEEFFNRLK